MSEHRLMLWHSCVLCLIALCLSWHLRLKYGTFWHHNSCSHKPMTVFHLQIRPYVRWVGVCALRACVHSSENELLPQGACVSLGLKRKWLVTKASPTPSNTLSHTHRHTQTRSSHCLPSISAALPLSTAIYETYTYCIIIFESLSAICLHHFIFFFSIFLLL